MNKVLKEALDRFALAEGFDRKQREFAVEDMRFAHAEDGQWSEDDVERRGNRPRYTFNRVIGVIKQITGDHKQNRSEIKFSPDSAESDDKTAKVLSGIARKIQVASKAQNAYENAFDEKVAGGYGGWRILTEYKEDSFNQDIVIKPIVSAATSHYIDPDSTEYDGRDSNYQFLVSTMSLEGFKNKYPKALIQDFTDSKYYKGNTEGWFGEEIRIAEYWRKTEVNGTLALLSDGRVIHKEDEQKVLDELKASGLTIIKERKVKVPKVEMFKMSGAEILEGPNAWAGKYIPLIPDYGEQIRIEKDRFTRGIVRFAKDANRVYNYTRSTDVESYALTPKDPIWLTAKQAKGHLPQLKTFPKKNQPFMLYNSDPSAPGTPQRGGAPSVQQAGMAISTQSIDDVHATTSMYPPAMGNAPQLLSEKSVKSQAEKGDLGAYIYQSNHEKSLSFTGEVLLDLIPRIMDTAQQVQILDVGGKAETVDINTEEKNNLNETVMDKQTNKPVIVNDLSLGKYSVAIETGPAFSTQKDEAAQQLIDLSMNSPIFAEFTPDLIAKNLNIVDSEEFVKRLRKWAINQGIAEPTEDEIKELGLDQPQQPNPVQTALVDNTNMDTEKKQSEIEANDAKVDKTIVESQQVAIDAYNTLLLSYQKQVDLGIPLTDQQKQLLVTQGDIVADAQMMTQGDNPNSEQIAEIVGVVPR